MRVGAARSAILICGAEMKRTGGRLHEKAGFPLVESECRVHY